MRGAAHPRRGGRRNFLPGGKKSVRDKEAEFNVEEVLREHKQIKAAMDDIRKVEGQEPAFGAKIKVLQEENTMLTKRRRKSSTKRASSAMIASNNLASRVRKKTSIRETAQPKARERKGVKGWPSQLMPING
jgi:hypothetical protein